jgi:hypothetical protein
VRVGGDFMHGRMMLAPTFLLLLPAIVLPVSRWTAPSLGVAFVWAVLIYVRVRHHPNTLGALINDERAGYVIWTQSAHPIDSELFVAADKPSSQMARDAMAAGRRSVVSEGGIEAPMNPALNAPIVFIAGRLGTGGVIAPIDGIVVDAMGLGNPFGARITPTQPGIIGHEKSLPWSWIRAEYTDPAADHTPLEGTPLIRIHAARRALQCGELKELMDSVRAPMTLGRFWSNLTGSFRRTRLVIPSDSLEAEWKFCGKGVIVPKVTASSSYEEYGWSSLNVIDGVRESDGVSNGYSSEVGPTQWIAMELNAKQSISKVVLYPRSQPTYGTGFPIDFTIQIWDGAAWVDRANVIGYPRPTGPVTFSWPTPDLTDRIRINATKLPQVGEGPRLQLAEIEVQ